MKSLLVYPKEAAEILGVGNTKFHEIRKLPGFPKPRSPDGKRPMYLRAELEQWIDDLEIVEEEE